MICSCIWVISCSCCCFSCSCCHCCLSSCSFHSSSLRLMRHCDLDICFIIACIWVICCLIQFISVDWLWLAISTFCSVVDGREGLDVLLKHFNRDSSLNDTFSYAMKSDLCLFNEDSMSESEAVDLGFLTCFVISGGMVDNSLRFWPVKSFWDLVVCWLITTTGFSKKNQWKWKKTLSKLLLQAKLACGGVSWIVTCKNHVK